jgi:predicted GH43/DUF377 family glycosyl hydrolase
MRYAFLLPLLLLAACQPKAPDDRAFDHLIKPVDNPVLRADSTLRFVDPVTGDTVRWQKADVFNPAAIVRNDTLFLLYRAEDNPAAGIGGRTSRIGLAFSTDGLHFTKFPEPVLYPDSDAFIHLDYPGGVEDPRVVMTTDSLYVMTYTSWNNRMARLSIAFSDDLRHWQKKGLAFDKAYDGKFRDIWSKSGSIVTEMKEGRLTAARLKGKYWMYWGEQFINLAWSENLSDWFPLVDEMGELKQLVTPRKVRFDSRLTECGPPALITRRGIMLLYNGKNAEDALADPMLPKGTYSVGKVIFNLSNPEQVVYRSDTSILKPSLPHEMTGQYKAGTTFAEGLVFFKSKWHLYYGTADSFVGLAVSTTE